MELAPEKLIEMLEKGESLPNVILMYGEENYYRSQEAACIKKCVYQRKQNRQARPPL